MELVIQSSNQQVRIEESGKIGKLYSLSPCVTPSPVAVELSGCRSVTGSRAEATVRRFWGELPGYGGMNMKRAAR